MPWISEFDLSNDIIQHIVNFLLNSCHIEVINKSQKYCHIKLSYNLRE